MLHYFPKVSLTNFFDCGVDRAVVPDDGPVEVGDGGDLLDAEVVRIQHTECFHRKANQGLPLKYISVFSAPTKVTKAPGFGSALEWVIMGIKNLHFGKRQKITFFDTFAY